MATRKQPPLSSRPASWSVFRCIPGSTLTFTGAAQVVKRVIVPSNAVGVLKLFWNGTSYASPTAGPLTIEPNGQYDYDAGFDVDCSLITAGDVLVEVCDLT
jgi:hypothetical protein